MDGNVEALAVPSDRTIVAGGNHVGFGRFGNDWLDRRQMPAAGPSGFLLSSDSDGAPRWARGAIGPLLSLAAGPDGRVAAITGGDLGPSRIVALGPDGAFLLDWRAGAPDAYPSSLALATDGSNPQP